MPLATTNPLIQVIPGLMIWTLVSFAITLWVLKRYAFGPIQKLIDDRRERIRSSVEEADRAREEARSLLEEHRALIGQARGEAESILAEARKLADAQRQQMRQETEEDRQRRLEETLNVLARGLGVGFGVSGTRATFNSFLDQWTKERPEVMPLLELLRDDHQVDNVEQRLFLALRVLKARLQTGARQPASPKRKSARLRSLPAAAAAAAAACPPAAWSDVRDFLVGYHRRQADERWCVFSERVRTEWIELERIGDVDAGLVLPAPAGALAAPATTAAAEDRTGECIDPEYDE